MKTIVVWFGEPSGPVEKRTTLMLKCLCL